MALTSDKAREIARGVYEDQRQRERPRLERIRRALQPSKINHQQIRPSDIARGTVPLQDVGGVNIPPDADPVMRSLAIKSRTNYLPKVLDEYAGGCIVQGYKSGRSSDNSPGWAWWQANGLDGRQAGLNRVTFAYGIGYGVALPGDLAPLMRFRSPLTMTAVYDDPMDDEWPVYALDVCHGMWKLYDDECVYELPAGGSDGTIEPMAHEMGVCPVVRYRDRMLLDDEPMGIIEPLISVQHRIDETTFNLMVAQHFAAFKQRYVIGWVPESEEERLKAGASKLWTFKDGPDMVKAGEFSEASLTNIIDSSKSAKSDMASIAHLALQDIDSSSVANLAADAIALLKSAKDDLLDEMKTSLGESHEQFFRLAAVAAGNEQAASDMASEVRWKDTGSRSLAQTADALGKITTMLQVPPKALWPKVAEVLDVSDQDLVEWDRLSQEGDALTNLSNLLNKQAQPPTEPPA